MSVFSDTLTRYIEHKNTKSSMENGTRHLLKFLKR